LRERIFVEHLGHIIWAIFVVALGACAGSFINVVTYRIPREMGLLLPHSQCMSCGTRLRFLRENLPIIGWLLLRGKCRFCQAPFSVRYLLVEIAMGAFFLGMYAIFFWVEPSAGGIGEIASSWWYFNGMNGAWPAWSLLMGLLVALYAMTVIDVKTYLIPLQIPLTVTIAAFLFWGVQAMMPVKWSDGATWPIPGTGWSGAGVGIGGMLGVVLLGTALCRGWLKYTFADWESWTQSHGEDEVYPFARREVIIECGHLLVIIIAAVAGWAVVQGVDCHVPPGRLVQALGGAGLGYLVGGGLAWGVRILGSLAFGREAMGLGDVHLMAAVGAVLGWFDPIIIFFLAPFIALLWTAVASIVARSKGGSRRELPYGPHLAIATLVIILARPAVWAAWDVLFPQISMPHAGLVEPCPGP
jgi:leader peptidase (prepilin peptidase)/N-methyltransferase